MAITRYTKNTSGCVVLDVKTSGIKKPKRFNKWYIEREKNNQVYKKHTSGFDVLVLRNKC
jgi:uncharacterized protein YjcR